MDEGLKQEISKREVKLRWTGTFEVGDVVADLFHRDPITPLSRAGVVLYVDNFTSCAQLYMFKGPRTGQIVDKQYITFWSILELED